MRSSFPARFLAALLICCSGLVEAGRAFAEPMTLRQQVEASNAILRVVVVAHEKLAMNEVSGGFQAIAKCRVIEDYRGDFSGGEFVFIPCTYNIDEDPSPIAPQGEYVVFLELLKQAPVGHPVGFGAVRSVRRGVIMDPGPPHKIMTVTEFVKRFSAYLEKPARPEEVPAADGEKKAE